MDGAGNVFAMDNDTNNNRVRRIDAITGIITTVAGGGAIVPGFGLATDMDLGVPCCVHDIAVDDGGNLFIANNTRIFKVDLASGILTVLAGGLVTGNSGDGGPAANALFNDPSGLAFTPTGALLVSDADNARIRSIAPDDLVISLETSQAFLDLLDSVPGSVLMVSIDGRDFLVIPNMTSVGANVTVTGNDQLLVLDLHALETVGGNLTLTGNLSMTSVDLSALTTVGGSLTISGNPVLSAVLISGITSIVGDLSIIGTAASVISLPSLTTVGGSVDVSGNGSATTIDFGNVTSVGGSVDVSGNGSATTIDFGSLTSTGGGVSVDSNTAATGIDLGSLTSTGGSVSVDSNTAATGIDLGSLTSTGGGVTINGNTSAGSVDVGSLASTGGGVIINGNTSADSVDVGSLSTVNGDLSVTNNGPSTTVTLGSLTSVTGNLTVETTGTGTFGIVGASVGGNIDLTTTGYTTVAGTTAAGSTGVSLGSVDAVMHAQIPGATFVTPVDFSVTRVDPVALPPEGGTAAGGGAATVDPIDAYQFTFGVPTLNHDATLSFDVHVAGLDAATSAAFLAALDAGMATLATKDSAAGSTFQAFPLCTASEVPTVDGCVLVERLDADGQPTTETPAIVRFSNVVGHFSTWAVAIVVPCTPEICNGIDDDCNGVIDDGGSALCDDGNECNGVETCDPMSGCMQGTPLDCDDSDPCTADSCFPSSGCVNIPNSACGLSPKSASHWRALCTAPYPSGEAITEADVDCVNDTATFADVQTVAGLCDRLYPNPVTDKCEQAEGRFMALMLNLCHGRVRPDSAIESRCTSNTTVGESQAQADALLSDPSRSHTACELAYCMSDEINSGRALATNSLRLLKETTGIRLVWAPPYGLDTGPPRSYEVRRRSSPGATFVLVGQTTETNWIDLSADAPYEYEIWYVW